MQINAGQVRAAINALGLDYDTTLAVTLTPGYAHVISARLEDGHPVLVGGVLQQETSGIDILEEAGE